jgi:PAS domain S-box-containing protein
MNHYEDGLLDTEARTRSERLIDNVREQGGFFVDAVRLTRMPMIVTDATLPGNPIIFANAAFVDLSGYTQEELTGQDPHFMNGDGTDPATIAQYQAAITSGRDENVELVQYRKDGSAFRAALFASPLNDGQGRVLHHFLSYLDITRRHEAEAAVRSLAGELEAKVEARTRDLQLANMNLTRLVEEKQVLMAEVNHRAKNSLAIAASLLTVQGAQQDDPQARSLLKEACDRIMAMARVHDLLSKSETSQVVALDAYLADLCEALRSMAGTKTSVSLASAVEPGIFVHADAAIPLGIIATELITNAIKYAFVEAEAGLITVEAHRPQADRIRLTIADNGRGMGKPRDGSLGYPLVAALVRQIRGEMSVASEGGVTITIAFPSLATECVRAA